MFARGGNFRSDSLNLSQATDKLSAWDPLCRLYLVCLTGQRWLTVAFCPAFAVGLKSAPVEVYCPTPLNDNRVSAALGAPAARSEAALLPSLQQHWDAEHTHCNYPLAGSSRTLHMKLLLPWHCSHFLEIARRAEQDEATLAAAAEQPFQCRSRARHSSRAFLIQPRSIHFKQEPCFRVVPSTRVSQQAAFMPVRASNKPKSQFYFALKKMGIACCEQGRTEGSSGSQDRETEGW